MAKGPSIRGSSPALETLAELGQLTLTASTVREVLLDAVERLRSATGAAGAGFLLASSGDEEGSGPVVETVGDLGEAECRDAVEEVLSGSDSGAPGSVARRPPEGPAGSADEVVWVFPVGRGRAPSGGIAMVFSSNVSADDPAVHLVTSVAGIVSAGLDLRGGAELGGFPASRVTTLMNSLPDPAVLLRPDGTIVTAAESAGRMLHWDPKDLVGKKLGDLVIPEERESLAEGLGRISETGGMETTVAMEVAGGLRKINVHMREIAGGELLALLRDHTRFAARDRGRRILLDHGPRIAAAESAEEIWSQVWEAVRELVPRAEGLRIYRGDEAAVRLVWASDLPPGFKLSFTVRGWGPKLLAMLKDSDRLEAFADRLGDGSPGARGRLVRFFSGRGNPLLLDDPDTQLKAFVNEEELERIRASRFGAEPPGQEILCPLVVEGRIDLVAVLAAPPREHPFTWDDAADVWQLIVLAREVAARQEAEAMIERHRRLARTYRQTLRSMGNAADLVALYSAVSEGVLRDTGSNAMVVLSGRNGAEVDWFTKLEPETVNEIRLVVTEMLRRSGSRSEPVFVGSAGADEVVGELGVALRGVEAMAVVPAYLGGIHLATLILTWQKPREFGRDERALVEFLGIGLAMALSNHRLNTRLSVLHERMQRVAGAVDQGLMEVDGTGRIVFINPLAMRLLGITDVEARRRALLGVVAPELQHQLIPVVEQILQGREVEPFVLSAAGRRLKIRVVLEPDAGGAWKGATSTWSVTEQGEAEQRRLRLEKMLAVSSDIIIDLAPDGTVLGTNPAAARFLEQVGALAGGGGVDRSAEPMTWRVLGPEELETLRSGQPVRKTGELLREGGAGLAWEAEFHAMDASGEMTILAVVRDRSERQALAKARETLHRVADALLHFEGSLVRLNEIVARGHDLATAVMVGSEPSAEQPEGAMGLDRIAPLLTAAESVAREAPDDRRVVTELEKQLDTVRQVLRDAVGVAGRTAWVVADRPWRAETIVREIERVGWNCEVVLPNDTLSRGHLVRPRVVVFDVGSLTMAIGLYSKFRESFPGTAILLAVPLAGAGAGGLSEDPRLRIVEAIPVGAELQELLNELTESQSP